MVVGGSAFAICTSFRTVLKILRLLDDPEVLEEHKNALLCKWFFPQEVPENWPEVFGSFLRCGDEPEQESGKELDYEFDAPEIYSSFMQLYGIDLFETDMHWWKFRALLTGCIACPCALREKLRLRRLDVSCCADRAEAQRAKDSVQIPDSTGENERILQKLLQERLLRGEDISDLLR